MRSSAAGLPWDCVVTDADGAPESQPNASSTSAME